MLMHLQSLATPEAFEEDPSLVWEFYHYRREVMGSKEPNKVGAFNLMLQKLPLSFILVPLLVVLPCIGFRIVLSFEIYEVFSTRLSLTHPDSNSIGTL